MRVTGTTVTTVNHEIRVAAVSPARRWPRRAPAVVHIVGQDGKELAVCEGDTFTATSTLSGSLS